MEVFLLLSLLMYIPLYAAEPIAVDDSFRRADIGTYTEYLEDKGGKLTIQEAMKHAGWEQSKGTSLNFGYTDSAYWFRITVNNTTRDMKNMFLEVGYSQLHLVYLYIPDRAGSYRSIKTGVDLPFHSRDVEDRNFVFTIEVIPGENTYYLRIQTLSSLNFPLVLWSTKAYISRINGELSFLWLYIGIIIALIIYNFLIFLSDRDISFIFCALFILSLLLVQLHLNGLDFQYLWPESIFWNTHFIFVSICFGIAFMTLYVISFLDTRKKFPRYHNILVYTIFPSATLQLILSLLLSSFLLFRNVFFFWVAYSLIMSLILVIYGTLKGSRHARFLFIGFSAYITGYLILLAKSFGLMPVNILTMNSHLSGTLVMALIFSMAISDKISIMDKMLKASEEKYRDLVEKINDMIYALDDKGIITYVSPAVEMYGYAQPEIIGRSFTEIIHKDDIPISVEGFQRVVSRGEPQPTEFRAITRDGEVRWARALGTAIYDGDRIVGIRGVLTDITGMKKAEEALRERLKFESLIADLASRFVTMTGKELGNEIDNAMQSIVTTLQVDRSTLFEYNESKKQLQVLNSWASPGCESAPVSDIYNGTFLSWAAERLLRGEIIKFSHLDELPDEAFREREVFIRDGTKSNVTIPLIVGNSLVGVISFGSLRSEKLWPEDLIQRLQLVSTIFANVMDRQRAEKALRESEAKYRELVENISDIIYSLDADATLTYVSPVAEKQYGYKQSEIVGKNFIEFVHEDDRQKLLEGVRRSLAGIFEIENAEFRIFTKSGELRWVRASENAIYEKDRIIGTRGVMSDITERKRAEEALRESEERYRMLIETLNEGILIVDESRVIRYVNQKLSDMLGYTADEIIGTPITSLVDGINLPILEEQLSGRRMGKHNVYEIEWKRKDGKAISTIVSPQLLFEGDLFRGSFAAITDITERKKSEEALRESEEKYRNLVERANDGIAIVQNGKLKFINNRIADIIGYTVEEITNREFALFLHPDDINRVVQIYERRLAGEEVFPIYEVGAIHKNGSRIEIEINAGIIHYQGKQATLAIVRDITARKKTEEQIRSSLREKEALLKEIHHRVKNNMQIISSLLRLQIMHIHDKRDIELFQDSMNRVRSMALVHEKLYQSQDLGRIDLGNYIQSLTSELFRTYQVNPEKLRFSLESKDILLGIDTAIPCALIINELVSNALKHAFPDDGEGEIRVALRKDTTDTYGIDVSDNGVGIPETLDFQHTESMGLQLINILTEQIGGTVELNRNGGTRFIITFTAKSE